MERNITCIICPRGCPMTVKEEGGKLVAAGFTCPKGEKYAIDECTNPVRTITTTARTSNGGVIPVKTANPIPKELMFDCMQEIDKAIVTLPAQIGDVVIENLLNTGVDVVVTANMK